MLDRRIRSSIPAVVPAPRLGREAEHRVGLHVVLGVHVQRLCDPVGEVEEGHDLHDVEDRLLAEAVGAQRHDVSGPHARRRQCQLDGVVEDGAGARREGRLCVVALDRVREGVVAGEPPQLFGVGFDGVVGTVGT